MMTVLYFFFGYFNRGIPWGLFYFFLIFNFFVFYFWWFPSTKQKADKCVAEPSDLRKREEGKKGW